MLVMFAMAAAFLVSLTSADAFHGSAVESLAEMLTESDMVLKRSKLARQRFAKVRHSIAALDVERATEASANKELSPGDNFDRQTAPPMVSFLSFFSVVFTECL